MITFLVFYFKNSKYFLWISTYYYSSCKNKCNLSVLVFNINHQNYCTYTELYYNALYTLLHCTPYCYYATTTALFLIEEIAEFVSSIPYIQHITPSYINQTFAPKLKLAFSTRGFLFFLFCLNNSNKALKGSNIFVTNLTHTC